MFECHITIEPVPQDKLEAVEYLAKGERFKLAKLLMQNRDTGSFERSMYDTFMTGHDASESALSVRMANLCHKLTFSGFAVWRYKIEEIKLDSRNGDLLNLLTPQLEKAFK